MFAEKDFGYLWKKINSSIAKREGKLYPNYNMQLDQATDKENLLLEAVSGSNAYGLATETSDLDIRGIFMLPKRRLYGLKYTKQVNDKKNDIVYYELRRFFDLALENNPNILELLAIPDDCLRYRHPIIEQLKPEFFLSKNCRNTFMGYATQQISKAHGMKKKIVNPMDKKRKSVLAFCFVTEEGKAVEVEEWLSVRGFEQKNCGLVNIDHMRSLYALYYDASGTLGYQGILKKDESNDVGLSNVAKGEKPLAYLSFNKDGYSTYCKDYLEYWDWVKNRNDARFSQTETHGKGYDAKNMMHCFRLLEMAEEIARDGIINVRRPNRDELLNIRSGAHDFETLKAKAEAKMADVNALFDQSSLPDKPDTEAAEALLAGMREEWYR